MIYMKRILRAIAFFMGLVLLLLLTSNLLTPKDNREESGMEEVSANGILGEKKNSIEVLVLGDSESYSSINPLQIWRDTGYTSYVCGTSGQPLDYTETMLHRAFENQSPKIVILETNAIYRKLSKKTEVFATMTNYFSVFRYHNRWKSLLVSDLTKYPTYTWTDEYKGYRHRLKVEASDTKGYMKQTEEKEEIASVNRHYVEAIQKYCDAKGAKLVLLSTPSTVNWNYKRHNGIQELATEMGVEYIDLNLMPKEVPIDWSQDTRDKGDHLNYYGAKKVTAYLSDYLSKTGLLTSQKGNPAYASWDKDLSKFEKTLSKK